MSEYSSVKIVCRKEKKSLYINEPKISNEIITRAVKFYVVVLSSFTYLKICYKMSICYFVIVK